MSDPLSIATSVVAFVELASRIIRASQYCIDAIKDAPSDIQMILGEVSSIKAIVENFEEPHPGPEDGDNRLVSRLFAKGGPIEACQRCLGGLEGLLPMVASTNLTTKRRGFSLVELSWPLKQSKARRLLAEISHHKATLLLAISGDMTLFRRDAKICSWLAMTSKTSRRLSGNFRMSCQVRHPSHVPSSDEAQSTPQDSERHEVFKWLERQNPSALHNTAFHKHEPHTSAWLLRAPEWQKWLVNSPTDRFLWIHGLPGSGKTVLASFIIESLKENRGVGCCLAYYYCHYTHNQDEAAPFLTWTISQICRHIKWVPPRLKELFDQGCDASIPELENVLEVLLSKIETLYLVIDAIDESIPRDDLTCLIATMVVDKRFRKIRILATSRQYFDIERLFSGISTAVSMSNPSIDADIRHFVHARLSSSRHLYRWRDMLSEIEEVLISKANGMFRWVECQIQAIEHLRDRSQLRPALENLPQDISETYVRIFDAIPEADRMFVRQVLVWVIGHSEAPWIHHRGINADVLLSAVKYDMYGSRSTTATDAFECDYLQELCGCLLTFLTIDEEHAQVISTFRTSQCHKIETEYQPTDLKNDMAEFEPQRSVSSSELFVTLAHYTVLEFIVSPHIMQTPVSCFALSPDVIKSEFASSVLRQALMADPMGTGTDWVYDREAYSLTLGCALGLKDFLVESPTQDLFVQYFCPSNPHFSRFWPIQQQLVFDHEGSSCYYLASLPSLFHETRDGFRDFTAETLLCILMTSVEHEYHRSLIWKLTGGRAFESLLETRVSASFIVDMDEILDEMSGARTIKLEGTVWEIVQAKGTLWDMKYI
ncbi:hypothetical protein S7711_09197 [Stachybotrys chartarum IBT 7711]|uniref:NACHT domain-containing protein n=1 Tax=Stachybotrys chartarum (strain CBS 109288 / IBT 7711) TaxID=1280523 RepID=A0A084B7Q3_STACB|nr:hypothetical protein S7711_09197 [Stachybotrys chartarum IBT 7711]